MKKLIKLLFFAFAMFACLSLVRGMEAKADTFADNNDGTVAVVYNNSDDKQLLIMVEGTDTANKQRYYYKLNKGKNDISVPLTEGNGTYKIRLCQVRSDGKAAVLESQDFSLKLSDTDSVFLRSSVIVNYAVSNKVTKKAKSLTKKCKTEDQKIEKVYKYVVSNYKYDYDNLKTKTSTSYYVPDITATFKNKKGICYDISCVIAAMLRSQGIETKVVTGHTPNVKEYHAWNQIKDSDNKWFTIDATYDVCLYKTNKNPTMKKKDSEYSDIVYKY